MKQRIFKILLLSFAICLLLISIGALSACGVHVHNFGDYEILTAADCETNGEKARTCLRCGYQEKETILAGHNWSDFEIIQSAECEIKGEKKRTCSICNNEDIEVIPALEHIWSDYTENLPARCGVAGEKTRTCDLCSSEEKIEIPALTHVWSDYAETEAATCGKSGEKTRSCSLCNTEEKSEIPKLEHRWSDYTETSPARCGVAGEKTRVCELCSSEEKIEIPALTHVWSDYAETVAATCNKSGEKTRSCSLCHAEEKLEIPKLEHKWSDYTETLPARCGVAGEKTRTCELCKKVEKADIPALEHVWTDIKIIKEATCVEDGIRSVTCKLCSATLTSDVIPATGHTKASGFPLTEPTCESTGQNLNKCAVCGDSYREIVPATGHKYSDEFTIDKLPTLYEEGVQSRHCVNYKCNSRTDIQSVPRLISEAYFRIYVVHGEKNRPPKLPIVIIKNANGVQVASGYCFADDQGNYLFERRLSFGTYTVTLADVPEGFVHGEYTISEADGTYPYDTPDKYPSITIHLYSYLGQGSMPDGSKRKTVLNDFSFTTIDNDVVWLSDLLKTKKVVWLNFYYNACGPCQSEAPTIARLAQKYNDDLAVVCFNGKDDPASIRSGAASIFKYPDTFYFVDDRSAVYGKMFGRSGYPLNVFIDSGGYVFESVSGSNYSSQFDSFISNNLFETPPREDNAAAFASISACHVILPEKQRFTRKIEVDE